MAMKTITSSSLSQGAKNKINENFAELAGKSGTSTTATAAELNYLDITTLGTGAASKAVVLDTGEDYTWPATGVLRVGVLQDKDGVALTATATELNILDTVTATSAELNILDDICADITITYAASTTEDGIEVTFTVVDAAGVAIDTVHQLTWYISDDTDGGGLTAAVPDGALTAVTGVNLYGYTAKIHIVSNTDLNGVLTILVVDSVNTVGQYFCVVNPVNGKVIMGPATEATDYGEGI